MNLDALKLIVVPTDFSEPSAVALRAACGCPRRSTFHSRCSTSTSGASQIAFTAMEILGVNGVFILTGVPGRKGPIEIDADRIMRNLVLKNQLVYGTVNAGRDAFEAAVSDLTEFRRRWPKPLAALITGRYPPEACRDLLLDPQMASRAWLTFAPRS